MDEDTEEIDENLELNFVDLNNTEDTSKDIDEDEDLGLEFEGEALDLDEVSRKDTEKLLNENFERPKKAYRRCFKK